MLRMVSLTIFSPDFKEIPDLPNYLINTSGQVYSLYVNRCLSPYLNNKGYLCIKLRVDGKTKTLSIHRLLAHTFLGMKNLWNDKHVDHINRDFTDNSLGNLQVLEKEEHYLKTLLDNGKAPLLRKSCKVCGNNISKGAIGDYCISHRQPDIIITLQDIEFWVSNYSWSRASRELGLTDSGLRKRYTKLTGKSPKDLKKYVGEALK